MFCVKILWLALPFSVICSDFGVVIFGGESPGGVVDTVSVLTKKGWCPKENVIIPPLPMASSGLEAVQGPYRDWGDGRKSQYIVVCGFPGNQACYYTAPLDGRLFWTPVEAMIGDGDNMNVDMNELEFIHAFTNMKAGISSLWKNKKSGQLEFLWSMAEWDRNPGSKMYGWLREDSFPGLPKNSLGIYPKLNCISNILVDDGYPWMISFSGGFDGLMIQEELIVYGSYQGWQNNSLGIGEPRAAHSCLRFELHQWPGLLLAGGIGISPESGEYSTLNSMHFMYPNEKENSDDGSSYEVFEPMIQPRSEFGLAEWGSDLEDYGLVAIGGKQIGNLGNVELLYSVEVWDQREEKWAVREELTMDKPLAGFGILTRGLYQDSLNDWSDLSIYCSN